MYSDCHYDLTLAIALRLCYPFEKARLVASANDQVDHLESTQPEIGKGTHNRNWHAFTPEEENHYFEGSGDLRNFLGGIKGVPKDEQGNLIWKPLSDSARGRELKARAMQADDPHRQYILLGRYLHFVQDWWCHQQYFESWGHGLDTAVGNDADAWGAPINLENNAIMVGATVDILADFHPRKDDPDFSANLAELKAAVKDELVSELLPLLEKNTPANWREFKPESQILKKVKQNILAMKRESSQPAWPELLTMLYNFQDLQKLGDEWDNFYQYFQSFANTPGAKEILVGNRSIIYQWALSKAEIQDKLKVTHLLKEVTDDQPEAKESVFPAQLSDEELLIDEEAESNEEESATAAPSQANERRIFFPMSETVPPEVIPGSCEWVLYLKGITYFGADIGKDLSITITAITHGPQQFSTLLQNPQPSIQVGARIIDLGPGRPFNPFPQIELGSGTATCGAHVKLPINVDILEADADYVDAKGNTVHRQDDHIEWGNSQVALSFDCDGGSNLFEVDFTVEEQEPVGFVAPAEVKVGENGRFVFYFRVQTRCLVG